MVGRGKTLQLLRGRSSGGERLTHIQEVGGSKPLVPTTGIFRVFRR